MTLESYLKATEALGVTRGALGSGFGMESPVTVEKRRVPTLVNRKARLKVSAQTLGVGAEDLSHMNPESWKQAQARFLGRKKAKR